MTRWKLVIDNTTPVHQFVIREVTDPPYIGIEIARVNPGNIVYREKHGKLIAAAPAMFDLLQRLTHYFDGLEGPYSDMKRDIVDVLHLVEEEA
jgi:hypothetical protein